MERITCPLMRFTSKFYQEDVRRGVEEILRRRAVKAAAEQVANPQLADRADAAGNPHMGAPGR